ncbi:hypothetical protein ES332_D10G270500v1 [Gossypium tomentosum]|uniref:DUF674 family protein n=1 Tax=Gossypium tomentosum TaxID=34277 RepID=A0A5D2J8Y4_GOSTO|nr:hypothetical protein ES332_D10G270500v1 [Gossypium tomentosum]
MLNFEEQKGPVRVTVSKSKRVLFAEAGKGFVDFLFSILSMPVGTVIRLLTKQGMVRCLGNLYGCIENLGNTYMQSLAKKDTLSKPTISNYAANNVPLLFPNMKSSTTTTKLYGCSDYCCFTNLMNQRITLANQRSKGSSFAEGGYVEGVVTYMVMNDLVVRPMSKISSITLLNKFKFLDVGGIKLLRASLQSKMVLTAVFLGKEIKLFLK